MNKQTVFEAVLTGIPNPAPEAVEDYRGEDGILYCGKCHTPREARIDGIARLVPVMCKCVESAQEERDSAQKTTQFRADMNARWDADGICDRTFLSCSFSMDDGKTDPAKVNVCRKYVSSWDEMQAENLGILFFGNVGTGKSFLMNCIAHALYDRQVPVCVTSLPRFLNQIWNASDRQGLIDRIAAYPLLCIDDFGVEQHSDYKDELIFGLLDARSKRALPLIVTTNLTLDELTDPNAPQNLRRFYDRITEMCPVHLRLAGVSRRASIAEAKTNRAREMLL